MRVQIDRYRFVDTDAPTLRAESVMIEDRELWRVWCGHCRDWHYHGPAPGHRIAHCEVGGHSDTGYNLQPPEGWYA